MKTGLVIIAFIICAALSASAADPTPQQALKDWEQMVKTHDDIEARVGEYIMTYKTGIIGTDNAVILEKLNAIEKDQPEIEKQLNAFAATYGKTRNDIDSKIWDLTETVKNQRPDESAGNAYEESKQWLDNIKPSRKEKAGEFINQAEGLQSNMDSYKAYVTDENFEKMKGQLGLALQFDPENEKAKEMLANVDKLRTEKLGAIQDKIDAAEWPGHFKNFTGPGDPDDLAEAAMEYLRADEEARNDKNPERTIAVAIRGNWYPFKKNILGETIQWGLPIWGACYNEKEKKEGICRVFSLTVLTGEEKGVKQAPPFTGVTVGDIYTMRVDKVKATGGGGSTTGGFFGFWFRIFLSAAAIMAGLLAAAPLLAEKVPQLKKMYAALTPLRNVLGVVIFTVGVVSLLRAILFCGFAVFADILPQIAVILTGILLGKEILFRKPAHSGDAASKAEKVQERISQYEAKIAVLDKFQVPLGIACIVLGVLHLLLGGFGLV